MRFLLFLVLLVSVAYIASAGKGNSKSNSEKGNTGQSDAASKPGSSGNKGNGNAGSGNGDAGQTDKPGKSGNKGRRKKERDDVKKLNNRVKKRENVDWKTKKGNWTEERKKKPKKQNKNEKKRKSDKVLWKGKVKYEERRDEKAPKPSKAKKNKSCVVDGKSLPDLKGQPSLGPKADGVDPTIFKPCDKRKRGGRKQGKRTTRRKRSESYASTSNLWDDPSLIPVIYTSSWPAANKPNLRAGMAMWEKHTCLRFQDVSTVPQSPYINVKADQYAACGTNWLGPNRESNATDIHLNSCKSQNGTLCHEMGHLIGLTHSQERSDRDQHVKVYLDNVRDGLASQFALNSYDEFGSYGVPYYYDSIMHYGPQSMSKNGRTTTCPLEPLMELVMGQREEPAFGDIALLNKMYCQVSCYNRSELIDIVQWKGYSQTISGRKCQSWNSQVPHAHGYTYKGDDNTCRNDERWAGGTWCFTTDPLVLYEPCISACEDLEAAGIPYCHGYCQNGGYHDPNDCRCICPVGFSGKDCSVEDVDAKYDFVPCGGKISLIPGAPVGIHSPNWPAKYPTNVMCMWWVVVPENHIVKLNITTFDLEEGDESGCYDYLEIRKEICEDALVDVDALRYCGKVLDPGDDAFPYSVTSTAQDMVIKFYSDDSELKKGFTGVLHAVATPAGYPVPT